MKSISFFSEGVEFSLTNPDKYILWLSEIAKNEGKEVESLTYIFCSDSYLLDINKKYLNHDYYTDIITFDNSTTANTVNSDMFISIDTVKSNAITYNETFEDELSRVIVHGLLHVLGYNDKVPTDQKLMREKENTYISLLQK